MCKTPQSMLYCSSAKLFQIVVLHTTFVEFSAPQTFASILTIDADSRTVRTLLQQRNSFIWSIFRSNKIIKTVSVFVHPSVSFNKIWYR